MTDDTLIYRDQCVADAFTQGALQDWMPLQITQLSSGDYRGHVRSIEQREISVFFEAQNCAVHKRGVTTKGLCTVSFFRENHHWHRFSVHRPEAHSLFLLPGGAEFDIHVKERSSTVYFLLEQRRLLDRLRALNPRAWEVEPDDVQILGARDRGPLDVLADLLCSSDRFAGDEAAVYQDAQLGLIIADEIVLAMSTSMPCHEPEAPGKVRLGRARTIVARSIEYVQAELREQRCPSIVDVCLALHVSQRTLQYCFQYVLGLTPIAYVRYLRLNQVRHELLTSSPETGSVTDVATRWHFLHLSKFASDYQRMFGESPSKTLRRAT